MSTNSKAETRADEDTGTPPPIEPKVDRTRDGDLTVPPPPEPED